MSKKGQALDLKNFFNHIVRRPPLLRISIWDELPWGCHSAMLHPRCGTTLAQVDDQTVIHCLCLSRTVLAIKPGAGLSADEELRSICARTSICHAEQAWPIMVQPEILILKSLAVDRLPASTISMCEVAALAHKFWYNPAPGKAFCFELSKKLVLRPSGFGAKPQMCVKLLARYVAWGIICAE